MRLVIAELAAYSRFVTREFSYIIRELVEVYGWQHLEPGDLRGGSMRQKIVEHCGALPEVVLFWGGEWFVCEQAVEIAGLSCAKWFVADDLHHRDARDSRAGSFLLCDTVLAAYAYRFACYFEEVARTRRVLWLPHSASPDFALPFNENARNELLLSGAICNAYPMRQKLRGLMESGWGGIVRQPHPGYHCGYRYGEDARVGRAFARRIQAHRAAFTDCTIFQYTVAKHFEIPATGALLLADATVEQPLRELGFEPGVHYLPVTAADLEDRLHYLLCEDHHAELDQIRRNGQALVFDRHRTSHRAKLLNDLTP